MPTTDQFFVVWAVSFNGYKGEVGPFKNRDDAEEHARDIRGFEGVHSVQVLVVSPSPRPTKQQPS